MQDEYMILRLKMKTLAKGWNLTTVRVEERVWERKGRNRGLVCLVWFLYIANIATILTRPSTSHRRILQQKTFVSAWSQVRGNTRRPGWMLKGGIVNIVCKFSLLLYLDTLALNFSDCFYSDKYESKQAAFLTRNVTSRQQHLLRYI